MESLLSSDFGIEMTFMAIGGDLRSEAGRASIQHAGLLKQHADHPTIMQTIQSSCHHHADHAITMQSPCNHHAFLLDPLMLQRTLSSTGACHTQSNRGTSSPKSSLIGFLGGCKTTAINSIVDGWVHPAVHLINC